MFRINIGFELPINHLFCINISFYLKKTYECIDIFFSQTRLQIVNKKDRVIRFYIATNYKKCK